MQTNGVGVGMIVVLFIAKGAVSHTHKVNGKGSKKVFKTGRVRVTVCMAVTRG